MAWSSRTSSRIRLVGWLAIPAGVLALLAFEAHPPVLCLWTRVFGVHCLGCGLHHAAFQLLRGRFHEAWTANPLVYAVLPLFAFLYARHLVRLLRAARGVRPLLDAAPGNPTPPALPTARRPT